MARSSIVESFRDGEGRCAVHGESFPPGGMCPICAGEQLVEHIAVLASPQPRPATGDWFVAYRDNECSTLSGPFETETAAIEEAKDRFQDEGDVEDEMVILRIARRLKLFTRVEVKIEE